MPLSLRNEEAKKDANVSDLEALRGEPLSRTRAETRSGRDAEVDQVQVEYFFRWLDEKARVIVDGNYGAIVETLFDSDGVR